MFGSIPSPTAAMPTQEQARLLELRCLAIIYHFGHVRRLEIARAVWPAATEDSANASAKRTLARLMKSGCIKRVRNTLASFSYLLIKNGRHRLYLAGFTDALTDDKREPSSTQFLHQTLVTCYLIERAALEGCEVWGHHAIGRRLAPVPYADLNRRWAHQSGTEPGKQPDGLLRSAPGALIDWLEVEHDRKEPEGVRSVLLTGTRSGTWLDAARTVKLGRLIVVYDREQNHEAAMGRGLELLKAELEPAEWALLIKSLVLVRATLGAGLHWLGHEEISGAQAFQEWQAANPNRRVRRLSPAARARLEAKRLKAEEDYAIDQARRLKKFGRY